MFPQREIYLTLWNKSILPFWSPSVTVFDSGVPLLLKSSISLL